MVEDFGEPVYNLEIVLSFPHSTTFISHSDMSTIDQIEMYGLAINAAKRLLKGQKHVTKNNYLFPGHIKGIKTRKAILNINGCNITELITLDKILKGEMKEDSAPKVHFFDVGNYKRCYVRVKDNYLYLDLEE